MLSSYPAYVSYILAWVISLVVSLYAVRKIIFITRKRKIFDIPDNIRKIHGEHIPSLGGIGVFIGYMAVAPFFAGTAIPGWNFVAISTIILFFTGIYDDIMNMRPSKKLVAQLLASAVVVYFAGIRLPLPGLPAGHIATWGSMGFTVLACTFFINVFNFIDGIDGLASLTAIFYTLVLTVLFAFGGHQAYASVCLCIAGASAGLLWFNYPPARIYMGDTGSMILGFSVFVLSVVYLRSGNAPCCSLLPDTFSGRSMLVMALLFPPVFDALRVFALRLSKGISPLMADRRHLHYYLLDAGLSHARAAWLLLSVNALTVAIALITQHSPLLAVALIPLPSLALVLYASAIRSKMA